MTARETIQITQIQQEIRELHDRIYPLEDGVFRIESMTREIQDALTGGKYSTDGGLVGRIGKSEKEIETVKGIVDGWKNKVIGIGIGLGVVSGGAIYKIIEWLQ